MSNYISVTVLNSYIKNIIDSEELLHNIALVGEVSGIRCSGAHAYFTLKDSNAQIDCCSFGYSRTYLPKSGESVILNGSLDFYGKGGKLTFIAKSIEPLGKGLSALQLEELKKKLASQGFFDEKHKKAIPLYCENVCVITAKTGAVIRDIVSTVRKKNKNLNIDVYDVKVQGNNCADNIISALRTVDKLGYDAVIIARGGGSAEDLMPFNDERLVYAVFEAKTPIISAVGHETDFTLCDFVSDLRVPTPTAGAEKVAYDQKLLAETLKKLNDKIEAALEQKLNGQYTKLTYVIKNLLSANAVNHNRLLTKVEFLSNRMSAAISNKITECDHKLNMILNKMDNNNPTKILKQGYFKIFDNKGHTVEIDKLCVGDIITIIGDKSRLEANVLNLQREE